MAIRVAIDGYDELEQIGVGGMAAVYRARKVSIDKVVAIKVLFPYLATDGSYIERFQREAKAAASIQHENIVNVIDFGESDGAFFIVMEYYDGRTLEQLMKERRGLPPEVSLRILLEVACGLEAAHALDIVHRDVKPANIIVTNQGGIKIADFGLARKSDSMTMITEHGKVVGTPAYMSPEQAAGRPVGPASDIFSFGVVAYELLGRCKPFSGQSYAEVLEKIQTFQPAAMAEVNPLIAPELERVVWRCLEKNESARYKHAGELIADLEAAMEKNQVARDRRQLSAYVKDPERYDSAFAEKTITECLSRGAFFMQKGRSHLDDAVLEYRRVLFLDPSHERALANLDRLRNERNRGQRTVMIDAVTPVQDAAGSVRPAGARKPRRARWPYAAAATLVVAGGCVWLLSHTRATDLAVTQSAPGVQARVTPVMRAAADTTAPDSARTSGNANLAQHTAEKPTMSASMDDAGGVPSADPPARTRPANGRETTGAGAKPAATGKHNTNAADTTRVASNLSSTGVTAGQSHAVRGPAPGFLSVYFLGAVGELWVDGKQFSRQPPFDKASIASGTHRVECRMNGEQEIRELTITIRPGRETVVEYEVGGNPVATDQ